MSAQIPILTERRLALLFIPRQQFMYLFVQGVKWKAHTKIAEGIPEDADVISVFASPERDGVMMLLYSPQFESVIEGAMPPILPISIRTR